jgi:hypothetical protein
LGSTGRWPVVRGSLPRTDPIFAVCSVVAFCFARCAKLHSTRPNATGSPRDESVRLADWQPVLPSPELRALWKAPFLGLRHAAFSDCREQPPARVFFAEDHEAPGRPRLQVNGTRPAFTSATAWQAERIPPLIQPHGGADALHNLIGNFVGMASAADQNIVDV